MAEEDAGGLESVYTACRRRGQAKGRLAASRAGEMASKGAAFGMAAGGGPGWPRVRRLPWAPGGGSSLQVRAEEPPGGRVRVRFTLGNAGRLLPVSAGSVHG